LQGFHQVLGGNGVGAAQVGDGPGDADDAMKAAGREVQAIGGSLQ